MGCVTQVGEQALNIGRGAVLVAGWPETVCATTVDRQCGSSLQTAFNSAHRAGWPPRRRRRRRRRAHDARSDGVESRRHRLGRREREDRRALAHRPARDLGRGDRRGMGISSGASPSTPTRSSRIAAPSRRATTGSSTTRSSRSRWAQEVLWCYLPSTRRRGETPRSRSSRPCSLRSKRTASSPPELELDRGRRSRDADRERYGRRATRPGAAGLLRLVRALGCRPVPNAPWQSRGLRTCAREGRSRLGQTISVIEVNEAFASVVLQFLADTGLHERWEQGDVNPNGGGISLGHPLGATGARITATLLNELERRRARYGIATMCIGQGQAIAGVLERLWRRPKLNQLHP